ncbi:MAG TPA: GtrA family protein [Arcobacter sp.]|nr:GtrA family protein [Arcobacter sp.]
MIKEFKSKEFLIFLFVGGFAALINLGSRLWLNEYMSFGKSVVLAYLLGMVTAFIFSKFFVFERSQRSTIREIFNFTLVNIVAIIQTYIISVGLAEYFFPKIEFTFYSYSIAHATGVVFPVFTSYLGHKYFTFKVKNV